MSENLPTLPPLAPEVPRLNFWQRLNPIAFAALALFLIFILYQVVAGAATILLSKGRITEENVDLIRWGTVAGQLLCILLPTLILTRWRHGNALSFLRVRFPDHREVIITVVGVFALQQMLQAYMAFQESIPLPPLLKQYVDLFKSMFEETYRILVSAHSPGELVAVLVAVALVPAVCEELLFRGLVQGNLEIAAGGMRGAVLAGIIFGAYHLNPFNIVPLAALGIYFGYIVYRSANISVAVSAHFFNNFVACVAVYMNLNDDFVAISPSSTPSGNLIVVNALFFTLVFIASVYIFHKITEHTSLREES